MSERKSKPPKARREGFLGKVDDFNDYVATAAKTNEHVAKAIKYKSTNTQKYVDVMNQLAEDYKEGKPPGGMALSNRPERRRARKKTARELESITDI